MLSPTLFLLSLGTETLAAAAVIFSIACPARRIWPPPRVRSWQAIFMWLNFFIPGIGIAALGIGDWGSWVLPPWIRFALGAPLWLAGSGLVLWATLTLRVATTLGWSGPLTQCGPYRFSRNPQYAGYVAALLGWGLLVNSATTFLAALAGIIPLILAPFAEEIWLLERYGTAYELYRRSTARFLSTSSLRRAGARS